jgi:hypothetical protein
MLAARRVTVPARNRGRCSPVGPRAWTDGHSSGAESQVLLAQGVHLDDEEQVKRAIYEVLSAVGGKTDSRLSADGFNRAPTND